VFVLPKLVPPVAADHQEYVPAPAPPAPVRVTLCPAQTGEGDAVALGVVGKGLTVTVITEVLEQPESVAVTVYENVV
jgi:hypothetical protein